MHRKLKLTRQTIKQLTAPDLGIVAGGKTSGIPRTACIECPWPDPGVESDQTQGNCR